MTENKKPNNLKKFSGFVIFPIHRDPDFVGSCFGFVVLITLFLLGGVLFAQKEYRTQDEEAMEYNVTRVIKTVEGLHFIVEKDRPIVKVDGLYRPLDLDSYIAFKFDSLEKKMMEIFQDLDRRLNELSRKVQEINQKLDELSREKEASVDTQGSSEPLEKK